MAWLMPILTFALGLSTSAALIFAWQASRQHLRERAQQPIPDEEESAKRLPEPATGNDGNVDATPIQATSIVTPIGFENPRRAFHNAFVSGNTEAAIALLPELEDMLGGRRKRGFLLAASVLASAGRKEALPCLLDALQSGEEFNDDQLLQNLVASTVQYYVSTDRELDGLGVLEDIIKGYAYDKTKSEETRAFIANQLQMLYFGSSREADALETIDYVIELAPNDASYYFNKSLILEKIGKLEDAIRAIEKCIDLDTHDDRGHLLQALDLYRKAENAEKTKATEAKLQA